MRTQVKLPSRRMWSLLATACVVALMIGVSVSGQIPADNRSSTMYGTVTGVVTDADTGDAIEGATVTIEYHDLLRTDLTDDAGRYTFAGVPICYCLKTISASKTGYVGQSVEVGVDTLTTVDFELVPDTGSAPVWTVSGTVTYADTGLAIEGALVAISYHETEMSMLTGVDGAYLFTDVPDCRCLKRIEVTKEGYLPGSKDVAVHSDTVVDFALEAEEPPVNEGIVSGVVTDASTGEPIEGALVILDHDGRIWKTWTDAEGWYELSGIPICYCLKDITASKRGYESQHVSVGVGAGTIVDFALEPGDDGRSDLVPGPRVAISFPGADGVPGRLSEQTVEASGFVGASVAVLATGLYACVVKM